MIRRFLNWLFVKHPLSTPARDPIALLQAEVDASISRNKTSPLQFFLDGEL